MKKLLIICAMPQELNAVASVLDNVKEENGDTIGQLNGKEIIVTLCKIGKVAAAVTTANKITQYNPDLIINVGVAGTLSHDINVGDVVIGTKVGYHDVDVTQFDYELGQMAQMPKHFTPTNDILNNVEGVHYGTILSGDQFVNIEQGKEIIKNFGNIEAVEMEAGAIAQTAHMMNKPFIIIRSISDNPLKEGNTMEFNDFVDEASLKAAELLKKAI